jgi:hypothetical protein
MLRAICRSRSYTGTIFDPPGWVDDPEEKIDCVGRVPRNAARYHAREFGSLCPLRVKRRNPRREQMSSALASTTDVAQ